jgi:hypothetical protein
MAGLEEILNGSMYKQFKRMHQTDTPKCCRGCGILWSP